MLGRGAASFIRPYPLTQAPEDPTLVAISRSAGSMTVGSPLPSQLRNTSQRSLAGRYLSNMASNP